MNRYLYREISKNPLSGQNQIDTYKKLQSRVIYLLTHKLIL